MLAQLGRSADGRVTVHAEPWPIDKRHYLKGDRMFSDSDHGFQTVEYRTRVERAQLFLAEERLDGLLLTSMDNIRYFTGIDSTFWESYTRPWFVLLPAEGKPIAIVPDIGKGLMGQTWLNDIRSWLSPCPEDEGTSLVARAISDLKRWHGRVGAELGIDLRLMMPVAQLHALSNSLSGVEIVDGSRVIWKLRMIKSAAEVAKIQHAINIAGAVYAEVPKFAAIGDSERKIDCLFRARLVERGADAVPVSICRAGPGGTVDVQGGPRDRQLVEGDVLFIDTGTTFDGYYCDYNRNYQVGEATDALLFAQERIWQAHEIGLTAMAAWATDLDSA